MKSILPAKKLSGLVVMTSGLVNASFSLPEWQAVKMIFFAPCIFLIKLEFENFGFWVEEKNVLEQRVQTNRWINSLASLPLLALIHPQSTLEECEWWKSNFATLYTHIIEGHQKIPLLISGSLCGRRSKGKRKAIWCMGEGRNLPSSLHTIRSSRESEIPLSFPSECLPRMVYLRL